MNKALAQKTPLAPGKIESNHHFPSLHPIKLISLNSTLNICENMFIFIVINRLSNKNTTIENWSTHWRQTVSWLVVRIVSLISRSHTLPKPRNTWSGEEEAGGETYIIIYREVTVQIERRCQSVGALREIAADFIRALYLLATCRFKKLTFPITIYLG